MANAVEYPAPEATLPSAVRAALVQRRTVLLVSAVVFLFAFVLFCGGAWAIALHGLLTDGAIALLWLLAAAGIGSLVPMPRPCSREGEAPAEPRLAAFLSIEDEVAARGSLAFGEFSRVGGSPSEDSLVSLRRVSAIAMGLGLISLITLGLGLAGLLNRATAWGLIAVGVVALCVRVFRGFDRKSFETRLTDWLCGDARHAWIWIPAIITLALACAACMALPGLLWNMFGDPLGYDVVEYHLQVPREWFEAGRILPLHHNAFSFFPFNVEMHYLLAMHLRGGPWAGMYLAQFMHVGFIALTVAAVAAAARATGTRPAGAAVAGLAAASTPWLLLLAPTAYNEGGLLLFGTLAVAWALVALRDVARSGFIRPFALGGAFAGFACGAKLTGVPIVLLAVAGVVFLALLVRRVSIGRALVLPVVFGLTGVLTFSPWLIRNRVWTGNPVFPEAASMLGKGHFTDVQVERWSRAHSARPDQKSAAARLSAALKEIGIDWRYGLVVLPLCATAGAATVRSLRSSQTALLALLLIQLIFWLGFTHLQSRFFVLSIPIAAMLVAFPRWRPWPMAALLVCCGVSVVTWVQAGRALDLEHRIVDVDSPELLAMAGASGDDSLAHRITSAQSITLIGDAKAFYYPTPLGGLHYRTVFDVVTDDSTDVVQAWMKGFNGEGVGRDLVIIDAGELDRFSKTYWKIPPLRGDFRVSSPNVVVRP